MKINKAFTLIELMVVVSIIAVLTAVAVVNYDKAKVKSRDVQRKKDLTMMASALETYKADFKGYIVSSSSGTPPNYNFDNADTALTTLVPNYIQSIPLDPNSTAATVIHYKYKSDSVQYKLTSAFESYISGDGSLCTATVIKNKAGDFCDSANPTTKLQISSSSTAAGW